MISKPILSEISRDRYIQSFVLDLDSGNRYKFKSTFGSDRWVLNDYDILNNSTMEFIGVDYADKSESEKGLCLFKQNILTGNVEKIRIANTEGVPSYTVEFIDTEHFIVEKKLKDKEPSGKNNSRESTQIQLNIFDLKGQKVSEMLLPEGVRSNDYLVNNGKCYFFEKLTNEHGYSYRVACGTADNTDKIDAVINHA